MFVFLFYPKNMSDNETINTRVGGLEDDVKNLTRSVGVLEGDVKNLVRTMESMTSAIQSLAGQIQSTNRTNWGVIGTWTALMVSVIGSIGYLGVKPMEDMIERERSLNVRQYEQIEKLKISINEEKILNARMEQKLIDLDKILLEIKNDQNKR